MKHSKEFNWVAIGSYVKSHFSQNDHYYMCIYSLRKELELGGPKYQ